MESSRMTPKLMICSWRWFTNRGCEERSVPSLSVHFHLCRRFAGFTLFKGALCYSVLLPASLVGLQLQGLGA